LGIDCFLIILYRDIGALRWFIIVKLWLQKLTCFLSRSLLRMWLFSRSLLLLFIHNKSVLLKRHLVWLSLQLRISKEHFAFEGINNIIKSVSILVWILAFLKRSIRWKWIIHTFLRWYHIVILIESLMIYMVLCRYITSIVIVALLQIINSLTNWWISAEHFAISGARSCKPIVSYLHW